MAVCAFAVALIPAFASEASAYQPCPSGGVPEADIDSWNTTWPVVGADPVGVTMCEGLGATAQAYVQIVDLADGGWISSSLNCAPVAGSCAYAGNPSLYFFEKKSAAAWHGSFYTPTPGRTTKFGTVNAGFFHESNGNTYLSLPANASGGTGRSDGYALFDNSNAAWIAPKKALVYSRYWDSAGGNRVQSVWIDPFPTSYTSTDSYNRFDDDVMEWGGLVGFAPDYVAPGGDVVAKRTYVGVNTFTRKVYVLSTRVSYTVDEAIAILKAFGSQDEIQLDGGQSTQLYSQFGQVSSEIGRTVPSALSVYARRLGS